jgi:hypothetical protein
LVCEYLEEGIWKMNSCGPEIGTALSLAQGKVENAKKTSNNPHFKSKYADLATIWDVIREPLTSEGLSVIQLPCEAPAGQVGLVTHILHKSGQSITERFFCGLKDATNPQQVGSCLTYMKRYALLGVAGIASEDDDGNAATGRPVPPTTVPVVDYTATCEEAIATLTAALNAGDEPGARAIYSTVNNSSITEPTKSQLLNKMAGIIKADIAVKASEPVKAGKGKK